MRCSIRSARCRLSWPSSKPRRSRPSRREKTCLGRCDLDDITPGPDYEDRGFLRSLSLFAELGTAELETLRILCHRRRHAAGSVILRQGQLGTDLYMIRD